MPPRRPSPIVTLTTDVGAAYAAQMKGVLSRYISLARVVDLTHDLTPHRIEEAAFLLRAMAVEFPPGTIHVAVVDPGVGGHRKRVGIQCQDGSFLVGPDNGVLMPLARRLGITRCVELQPDRIGGSKRVGTTFDGRDLFAPAAGRLARGTDLRQLGRPVRPRPFELPAARSRRSRIDGQILHIDRFGNLVTNVPTGWIPPTTTRLRVRIGRGITRNLPWVSNYETLGRGIAGGLGSSFGQVELAVAEGNASRRLQARVGDPVALSIPRAKLPRRARDGK